MWNLAYAAMDEFGGAGMGVQAILESIATQIYDIENGTSSATGAAGGLVNTMNQLPDGINNARNSMQYLKRDLAEATNEAERLQAALNAAKRLGGSDAESTITISSGNRVTNPKLKEIAEQNKKASSSKGTSSSGSSKITYGPSLTEKGRLSGISASSSNRNNLTIGSTPNQYNRNSTKKSHSGEPFVEKIKTPWDEALGLSANETLRILKVGERVIPAEQNIGNDKNLVERSTASKVSSMTSNTRNISNKNNSEDIIINMGDINIQGNATPDTVEALKKERESIIQGVFNRIEKHTKQSGFRNAKLFPIG